MILTEIEQSIPSLNRIEKLYLMRVLLDWFAKEEVNGMPDVANLITRGAIYPIWTPYTDTAAAEQMLTALEASA